MYIFSDANVNIDEKDLLKPRSLHAISEVQQIDIGNTTILNEDNNDIEKKN